MRIAARCVPLRALLGVWLVTVQAASVVADDATIRLAVIPPAPVTDKVNVELRVAIPNPTEVAGRHRVDFYWDHVDPARLISSEEAVAAPHGFGVARAWSPTAGRGGQRNLLCRVTDEAGVTRDAAWPIEVVESGTRAQPLIRGVWLDPLALDEGVYPRESPATEVDVRAAVDAYYGLGVRLLIVTYVEYQGTFYYPSKLRFHDRDIGREAGGQRFDFDVVGTILSQAELRDMHVVLGLGRGGDTKLLWEFDQPDWPARNEAALDVGRRVTRELYDLYGRYRSFYGWYLTHEMNDLARASAYYDPLADYCRSLSPEKPIMVAPAGTPVITREALASSRVDIFAYQDAVGAGYVPYRYTYRPEERLAQLKHVFAGYRALHEGGGKHLWADLELWEMDGSAGYSGAYAADIARVRRQLKIESDAVELITAYEGFGFLQNPQARSKLKDPRAARLFEAYADYARQREPNPR